MALYNEDIEPGKGIRILPKLKREHIFLTSFSKMRVDLAAQVGSNMCAIDLLANNLERRLGAKQHCVQCPRAVW